MPFYIIYYNALIYFQTLKECYERECENRKFNETGPKERNATNFKIKLLCRDDSSLIVKIVDDQDNADDDDMYDDTHTTQTTSGNNVRSLSANYEHAGERQVKGNLYMVKVEHGSLLSQKIVYIVSIISAKRVSAW